jgi:hypothetical protein
VCVGRGDASASCGKTLHRPPRRRPERPRRRGPEQARDLLRGRGRCGPRAPTVIAEAERKRCDVELIPEARMARRLHERRVTTGCARATCAPDESHMRGAVGATRARRPGQWRRALTSQTRAARACALAGDAVAAMPPAEFERIGCVDPCGCGGLEPGGAAAGWRAAGEAAKDYVRSPRPAAMPSGCTSAVSPSPGTGRSDAAADPGRVRER